MSSLLVNKSWVIVGIIIADEQLSMIFKPPKTHLRKLNPVVISRPKGWVTHLPPPHGVRLTRWSGGAGRRRSGREVCPNLGILVAVGTKKTRRLRMLQKDTGEGRRGWDCLVYGSECLGYALGGAIPAGYALKEKEMKGVGGRERMDKRE